MSHFFAVVLVPKDTKDIEAKVEELMAPYNENEKVDEYDHKCWCVNSEAREAGRLAAETMVRPFEDLRREFNSKLQARMKASGLSYEKDKEIYWDEQDRISKELDWPAHIKAYCDYEESATKAHPMFDKPKADCDECNGTAFYKSTYNPASRWDWWVIGGRWDGVIQNNYRSSENGFNFGDEHHQLRYNAIPVEDYLNICRNNKGQYPYSIITPVGEWCEKGKMGMFGISSGEKEDWTLEADSILDKYKDHIAIGVDCHI